MDEHCIQGLEALPEGLTGGVLTIGNFDGLHQGHLRIVQTACALARPEGLPVVAMTFEPPPDLIVRPQDAPLRIVPVDEKLRLLRQAGCDFVVVATTSPAFLAMSPEQFVEDVLQKRFAPRQVVEGPNFFFGCGRSGNIQTLQRAAAAGGFSVHVVEPVRIEMLEGSTRVSSSLIRRLIQAGRVTDAQRCLGRDFRLFGQVVPGTGRGAKLLGFPTVNLPIGPQVIPADGIYAGRATLDRQQYAAAVSIGYNPTLGGSERSIEAFLLEAEGNFYDQHITLDFVERIGQQERFDTVENLKTQIERDIQRVREILG